jgi:hypothetical protein
VGAQAAAAFGRAGDDRGVVAAYDFLAVRLPLPRQKEEGRPPKQNEGRLPAPVAELEL